MGYIIVNLVLINGYIDGKLNGKKKFIRCHVPNKNSIEEIKNYIRDEYALNMCDMWKIVSIELIE